MENITVSIIIKTNEMNNNNISCLDNLINQTLNNIEIIILSDDLEISDYDKFTNVYVVNKLKDINLHGEYTIIVNPDYQYLLVGLESLYNYSKEYDLDLLLFDSLKYDIKSKEIYETKSANKQMVNSDDEIFNHLSIKDALFSMPPIIFNIFYKTDFLKNKLNLINLENKKDETLLYFESIINAKKMGFFRNNIYIKKDEIKSMKFNTNNNKDPLQKFSKIEKKQSIKEIFYEFGQFKFLDIIQLTNELIKIFEENNLYPIYKYQLYDFKIELLKEFFFNLPLQLKGVSYSLLKSDFKILYSNKIIHSYIVTNLNKSNLKFYRNIIISKSLKELILIYEPETDLNNLEIGHNIENDAKPENSYLELKKLLLENESIKSNNNQLNSQISTLKSEKQKLLLENESIKSNNNQLNSQISTLKSENQKLKKLNQKKTIQISRLEDRNKFLNKNKFKKKKNTGIIKRFLNGN